MSLNRSHLGRCTRCLSTAFIVLVSASGAAMATPYYDTGRSAADHFFWANLNEEMQQTLNVQVNAEFEAGYIYLDVANHFYEQSLDGYGTWFTAQAYEELNHARKFSYFLVARGAKITLRDLPAAQIDKKDPLTIMKASLKLEEEQTKRIQGLYNQAVKLGHFEAAAFLISFLNEQVEEEDTFRKLVDRLTLLNGDPVGILNIDHELGSRSIPSAFVPPAH